MPHSNMRQPRYLLRYNKDITTLTTSIMPHSIMRQPRYLLICNKDTRTPTTSIMPQSNLRQPRYLLKCNKDITTLTTSIMPQPNVRQPRYLLRYNKDTTTLATIIMSQSNMRQPRYLLICNKGTALTTSITPPLLPQQVSSLCQPWGLFVTRWYSVELQYKPQSNMRPLYSLKGQYHEICSNLAVFITASLLSSCVRGAKAILNKDSNLRSYSKTTTICMQCQWPLCNLNTVSLTLH
jgi:hypothetical protein